MTRSIALSDEFYAQVTNRLEATHQGTFSAIVDLVPGGRPVDINDLVDILAPSVDIELANSTCAKFARSKRGGRLAAGGDSAGRNAGEAHGQRDGVG